MDSPILMTFVEDLPSTSEYIAPTTKVIRIPEEITDEESIGVACAFRSVDFPFYIRFFFERHYNLPVKEFVRIRGRDRYETKPNCYCWNR